MRDSLLTQGCMGTLQHEKVLKPGVVQYMLFQNDDDTFFYDKHALKYDEITDKTIEVKLKIPELLEKWNAANIDSHGSVNTLQEPCQNMNIPMKVTQPVINPGYIGKPKGALQIAYKYELINDKRENKNGKKVSLNGKLLSEPGSPWDTSTNLLFILSQYENFKFEVSKLEYIVQELGRRVQFTSKVHPEIAGRAIE